MHEPQFSGIRLSRVEGLQGLAPLPLIQQLIIVPLTALLYIQ